MLFRGIELHNVRELVYNEESGGYKMSRMPMRVAEHMSANTFADSGVELRFVPISDEVRIKIKKSGEGVSRVVIFYGSIQSGWQNLYKAIYDEPTEIVIPRTPRLDTLREITRQNGFPYSPEVVRVVLQNAAYEIYDVIGECTPPTPDMLPKKKYLAYGSSITHGSLAVIQQNTYVFRVGEHFCADPLNFGFAGNALLEPEVADYIADECEFDFATVEMGINLLNKIEVDEFEKRVRYFVKRIATAHPKSKIFCTDIFFMSTDILSLDNPETKANRFRRTVREVLSDLNLPNVIYLPGLSIMNGSRYLSEDTTHPNSRGVEEISRNLISFIEKHI